ncbi:hypothetical protein TNCV_5023501 [Trichonephila clavipes]|nr:hypothetical protein TNCV_5023501 [Trichonephila clavipes]
MMETGWSTRRVSLCLGHSDFTVWKCWDQWTREKPITRRPGSRRSRQTNSREESHIVRYASIAPFVSLSTLYSYTESILL